MNAKFYKCCAVPMCKSTTIKTPEKLFILIPKNQARRKWLTLARRDAESLTINSTSYFCEDHFDLEKDMENYMEYKTMGKVSRIRMKPDCLPTKFACQPGGLQASGGSFNLCRPAAVKRARLELLKECEAQVEKRTILSQESKNPSNDTGVKRNILIKIKESEELNDMRPFLYQQSENLSTDVTVKVEILEFDERQEITPVFSQSKNLLSSDSVVKKEILDFKECQESQELLAAASQPTINFTTEVTIKRESLECEQLEEMRAGVSQHTANLHTDVPKTSSVLPHGKRHEKGKVNKTTPINITTKRRSKTAQRTKSKTTQNEHSSVSGVSASPSIVGGFQPPLNIKTGYKSDCMYAPSSIVQSRLKEEDYILHLLTFTIIKIEQRPKFYIGVPKQCYFLIQIIHEHTGIHKHHILMCLKKIRLDSKFYELADEFGVPKSIVCRIFNENVTKIAHVLRPFLVNLDKSLIKRYLPEAFRKSYHKVISIIDCLEIEIKRPSKATTQILTWSEYKNANTVKYLISSTPNGLVNYVSEGYGGKISDEFLVENCDFLNNLPHGSHVMADKGFNHIEPLLVGVGCLLVRPPSESGTRLLRDKIKELRTLRIHSEGVIRQLRTFSMLKPHACINNQIISKFDDVIVIACALVNLQGSIINK